MRHGQGRYFAPDGADVGGLTAIQTLTLVQDATAHGVAHHVVIVSGSLGVLLLQLVGCQVGMVGIVFLQEVSQDLVEGIHTGVLLQSLLVDIVHRSVELALDLLAQLLVVHLVTVLALHVGAQLLRQLVLQLAHRLDGLGGSLQGTDEVLLGHLFHLALNHHNVVLGGTHHEIHIGLFHLLEGRVNNILTINASYANLGNGVLKGDI